jgi:acetaldehyde dehydrogenase/alcohol dehydrogenase
MLPHVLAYNASVPTKFMPSPHQRAYTAHKKYAAIAEMLGLGGETISQKVENLISATETLLDLLAFPRSIAAMGISHEVFEAAVPELARMAFDDPSWRTNPRMPLLNELADLFRLAYSGRGSATKGLVTEELAYAGK